MVHPWLQKYDGTFSLGDTNAPPRWYWCITCDIWRAVAQTRKPTLGRFCAVCKNPVYRSGSMEQKALLGTPDRDLPLLINRVWINRVNKALWKRRLAKEEL